ncbi:MAG: Imm50 family immunity protein [Candidatus Obscuribacterales bacterium]
MSDTKNIIGASRVVDWFGEWPDFAESQVLEIHLARDEDSWLKLRTPESPEKAATGRGAAKTAFVTFYFNGVTNADLQHFNQQSVVSALEVEMAGDEIRVTLKESKTGLHGSITAGKLSVGVSTQMPL